MKTIPSITEIKSQILTDAETVEKDNGAPLLPKAVWRLFAAAMSGALHLAYRFGLWAYKQIFTDTQDEEALVSRAGEYGLTKTGASIWKGKGTATGTDGTTIESGSVCQISGIAYQVDKAVTISGGSATVELRSILKGDDVNLEAGTELKWASPQEGLDQVITITETSQSGEDAETVDNLRARLKQRQQNQPQGGAFSDWIGWAMEIAGISEAAVKRPQAGFVTIYPLTDDSDPAERIPDTDKLNEVKAYLTDDERCPIRGTGVNVVAPSELEFDVEISGLSPADATTKAAILSAVTAYMYARRPKQYSDEADPIDVISAAEITAMAINAGAKSLTVTLKNSGGSSISDFTLSIGELSKLRSLTWV